MPEPVAGNGHHIDRLINAALRQPWAIEPNKGLLIAELLALRVAGARFTDDEVAQRVGTSAARPWVAARINTASNEGGLVAVLPLVGVISHRMGMFDDVSGGTSVQGFRARLREALQDPQVGTIVLDIDSPGGSTDGIEELGDEIHAAAQQKPVIAVANTLAASAGYWLASQASEVSVTPSGEVGSIGVYSLHQDFSAAYEQAGIKNTLLRAGEHKAEANPWEPLSDEAQAYLQQRVADFRTDFLEAVARGRGVTAAQVVAEFGEGRVFGAREAVRRGMADRVETLEQAITRAGGDLGGRQTARAAQHAAPRRSRDPRVYNYR